MQSRMKRIVIVAATEGELEALRSWAQESDQVHYDLRLVVSGMGSVAAACCTLQAIRDFDPDIMLQIGVGGSFDRDLALGQVVEVGTEIQGDLLIQNADGSLSSLPNFDGRTSGPDPAGELLNPHTLNAQLPRVRGLTVQTVTGSLTRIQFLRQRYSPVIESMEGAGFFYACLREHVKFFELRAISNYVEPRNRNAWQLELALSNLTRTVTTLFQQRML